MYLHVLKDLTILLLGNMAMFYPWARNFLSQETLFTRKICTKMSCRKLQYQIIYIIAIFQIKIFFSVNLATDTKKEYK